MNRILLFAPLALLACSQPEPVFNDANDVREAIMQVEKRAISGAHEQRRGGFQLALEPR